MKKKHRFLCTGCGFCNDVFRLEKTSSGYQPESFKRLDQNLLTDRCPWVPGVSVSHSGDSKVHPLLGPSVNHYIGYSRNSRQRSSSSSGGVLTEIIIHLLETNLISNVALPMPVNASGTEHAYCLVNDKDQIRRAAQSIYCKVPVGNILNDISNVEGKICFVGLPDQNQALTKISSYRPDIANKIFCKLGPMTGIMMDREVIEFLPHLFRNKTGVKNLRWRAGEWPGYLLIEFNDGETFRLKKFYYNFLLPFFCSMESLISEDFSNEYADISVGDAWSPKYEVQGKGFSLVSSKSMLGDQILSEIYGANKIFLESISENSALEMHLHMLDFKKRGSYYRKKILRYFGVNTNEFYGIKPEVHWKRYVIEFFIVLTILTCRTKLARFTLIRVNHDFAGKIFDMARLKWKALTKATKRKGIYDHGEK